MKANDSDQQQQLKGQKQALRQQIRQRLNALPPEQIATESAVIIKKIADYILANIPAGSTIASFAAMPNEPDLLSLHQLLPDHHIAYPLCLSDGIMDFYTVTDISSQFSLSNYGIREPIAALTPLVAKQDIALVIVPAFAFTSSGTRLGKGGGFYDRYLQYISSSIPLIGACLSAQLVDHIPTESHDIPVHSVICPI